MHTGAEISTKQPALKGNDDLINFWELEKYTF